MWYDKMTIIDCGRIVAVRAINNEASTGATGGDMASGLIR